jgi:solute carrier family 39 (zinc transporter), member 7
MVSSTAVAAALTSTALISLAPNLILVLFPQYTSGEGESSKILALGQALAAGGLLGDVFLHTIPHAGENHYVGLWILLGFTIFLVADMLIRLLGHSHNHGHKGGKEEHSGHVHKTSTVLLNLVADSLHNFTDGLAIGASFATPGGSGSDNGDFLSLLTSRGGLATLSILCHEIPHELGDFAILVKNGMSKQQAILAQFGTAVAALVGTMVGLFVQGLVTSGDETLIFVTSGGFIYLATVTILPEVLDEDGASLRFRFLQLTCFGAGIAFLYAVTLLEADGHGGHGHSHGHHDHGSGRQVLEDVHHHDHHDHQDHDHHHHDEHHDHHGHHGHHHEF